MTNLWGYFHGKITYSCQLDEIFKLNLTIILFHISDLVVDFTLCGLV